jgi:hypothetical protein
LIGVGRVHLEEIISNLGPNPTEQDLKKIKNFDEWIIYVSFNIN